MTWGSSRRSGRRSILEQRQLDSNISNGNNVFVYAPRSQTVLFCLQFIGIAIGRCFFQHAIRRAIWRRSQPGKLGREVLFGPAFQRMEKAHRMFKSFYLDISLRFCIDWNIRSGFEDISMSSWHPFILHKWWSCSLDWNDQNDSFSTRSITDQLRYSGLPTPWRHSSYQRIKPDAVIVLYLAEWALQ